MRPDIVCLAPMEGVIDGLMRQLLTAINPYDYCVTEFVRVVDRKVPRHTFYKIAPELKTGGKTLAGTPVKLQLLGQDPNWMAENAVIAAELGAPGVDINFGCPAQTVNKRKGGAVLLQEPDTIYQIMSKVKAALKGTNIPVSAKIRLGFNETNQLFDIVDAVQQANTDLLTIHARTKKHGYKPPAYWHFIADVIPRLTIPVVANGEIWSLADAQNCMQQANTRQLMLGRGALALPNLAAVLKGEQTPMTWQQLCMLIIEYAKLELEGEKAYYFSSRVKQWLRYFKIQYPQAQQLFAEIKTLTKKQEVLAVLYRECEG